ncbi:MAG: hypothetical protein IPH45_21385 [Bacteroidales bacterium]|nr:hypothetical protein [Bacteroidales bacterium]
MTIIGGPIGVQLSADPMSICHGAATTINSQTGGGGGNYSYSWQSIPPGFNSTLEDITVSPDVTTTYILEATDGFNTVTKISLLLYILIRL